VRIPKLARVRISRCKEGACACMPSASSAALFDPDAR
jgi:hypothetical protein